MENRFNNRDFEQFVKQNADQYRMFPSEKVWDGIHNSLHTRRRWYGIGLGLLILTTGVVTWVMLNTTGKNKQVVSTLPEITKQQPIPEKKQHSKVIIAPLKDANNKNSFVIYPDNLQKNLYIAQKTDEPAIEENENNIENIIIVESPSVTFNQTNLINHSNPTNNQSEFIAKTTIVPRKVIVKQVVPSVNLTSANDFSFLPTNKSENKENITINTEEKISKNKDIYPLSIESVINSYTHIRNRKKATFQVFFSPTISYRDLKENKPFINASSARTTTNSTPNYYYFTDINNIVTHKPDIGLQFGFSTGYPLFKNIRLIGGLQFNVSKYDIKAYSYPTEVVTIALSNAAGGTNTVSTLTNYRNSGGSKINWLRNLYFSASAPIGLEIKLLGNKKSYFGISGTVQPTFNLSNRAYLISTDYKNYAEIPSLVRKWNLNTGFEMFAGYNTGKLKWRIGPQVRYQAMSSYQKKYPVQEHLFDFGIKMGIMLNK
jgi:hypothetical protein